MILESAAFRSGDHHYHGDEDLFMNRLDQAHVATRRVIDEGEALLFDIGGRVSDGDTFMHEETGHLKRKVVDDDDSL